MRSAGLVEFGTFINDLAFTMLFVFEQKIAPYDMMKWLAPMLVDENQRTMLMHEEPLYVAADFLKINRYAEEFKVYEERYLQFRREFLRNRIEVGHPLRRVQQPGE